MNNRNTLFFFCVKNEASDSVHHCQYCKHILNNVSQGMFSCHMTNTCQTKSLSNINKSQLKMYSKFQISLPFAKSLKVQAQLK